ncbi:glycosyltransferase [Peribacillus butanolivorans]|uniref:glycosyltransferase n=1 Tax=Peribacillus butanolivorans TaxID=421767 RepID=UPI00366F98ED
MRVVFIRSNPVMPDPRVEKEVNTLIGLGYEVKVLAWNRLTKNEKINKHGELNLNNGSVPIRWFNIKASFGGGMKNLFALFTFLLFELGWLLKHRKEYDVIHACDFDTVIPAFICSKLFGKKYIYDIFDYYIDAYSVPSYLKPIIEKIDIFMIDSADAVIIVNEIRFNQIKKSNPKNIYVIHNSPDITEYHLGEINIQNVNSNKPRFVYVGILSDGRMLEEIVEVFETKKEWELHIGGFGELEGYVKEKSNENSNIFFYGKIPYSSTLKLEAESDVLFAVYDPIVPNHKYSSPNKFYEALILGKPIIVAEGTGIDKIVVEHKVGKAIAFNKQAFMNACHEIINIKKNNIETSNVMQEIFKEKYSWSIMEKRLKKLYNELKWS